MKGFAFLTEEYHLSCVEKTFQNPFGIGGTVYTYSYYNASGCFTIVHFPAKGELEFYYAERCGDELKELCGKSVDVFAIEKEIWRKHAKIGIARLPSFTWTANKILTVLPEVIRAHVQKYGELFGIKLEKGNEAT